MCVQLMLMFYVYGSNIHSSIFKQEYIKWNLLELRAAFIARVQIQTTDTIGFHIKGTVQPFERCFLRRI